MNNNSNEYVEFGFINWSFKFVQIYYRVSLSQCTGKISTSKTGKDG